MILLADSEGPDQTARMRRLLWAFAVRICPRTQFRKPRPNSYQVTVIEFAVLKVSYIG